MNPDQDPGFLVNPDKDPGFLVNPDQDPGFLLNRGPDRDFMTKNSIDQLKNNPLKKMHYVLLFLCLYERLNHEISFLF